MGPTYIKNYFSEDTYALGSIGDIPVSLRHFNEWLTGRMIKRNRYSINEFLVDFIKVYLPTYLRGNAELNDEALLGQNFIFGNQTFMGYGHSAQFKEEGIDTDPLTTLRRSHKKAAGRRSLQYELVEAEYRPLINRRSNLLSPDQKKMLLTT